MSTPPPSGSRPFRVICLTGRPGGVAAANVEQLTARLPEVEVVAVPADQPPDSGSEADCLIAPSGCPGLHHITADIPWVHVWGTGVEGLPAAIYDGRVVTCSRGASAVPIAEFVLATMLAFEKQLPDVWVDGPDRPWYQAQLGALAGAGLAVFGFGGIGQAVARLGLAFGMSVTAMRRSATPSPIEGVRTVDRLEDLVAGARHVVVAAPATAATQRVFGPAVFDGMGPGAHLVNVARGSLIDDDALRAALDSGRVARASLDTTDPEPLPEGHWLYKHPSVRISPHVSWSNPEGGERILEMCVDNVRSRLAGRPLVGVVDPVERY